MDANRGGILNGREFDSVSQGSNTILQYRSEAASMGRVIVDEVAMATKLDGKTVQSEVIKLVRDSAR